MLAVWPPGQQREAVGRPHKIEHMMNATKKLLTVKQAAEYAQVSASLVYEWCATRMPHYRVGRPGKRGCIRIDGADLDRFLAGLKKEGRQELATPPAPVPVRLRHLRRPGA
jgi:excisionase family DNA binding protein